MRRTVKTNIQKLKDGDKGEFERIYQNLFEILFSLSLQYTRNREVSEEFIQDAFLKLWEIRSGLNEDTNIKNLLFTIVKNNCLNYLRSQRIIWKHSNEVKAREYFYSAKLLNEKEENFLEFEELFKMVSLAIEKLPEPQKIVFKMSRFEEMKYSEIADHLHLSAKTIESRISKALKFLRVELKDYLALIMLIINILN